MKRDIEKFIINEFGSLTVTDAVYDDSKNRITVKAEKPQVAIGKCGINVTNMAKILSRTYRIKYPSISILKT